MLFQARRFVEYFPPFALIFAAFAWSPLFVDHQPDYVNQPDPPRSHLRATLQANLFIILLILAVAAGIMKSIPATQDQIQKSKPYDLYAGASAWLAQNIQQSNGLIGMEDLYHEAYRPQFHFTSRRGWNNDPNGMVYHQGEWHLFYQHNPFGTAWGNMHWGHAVSRDLVHWMELPEALYQKSLADMAYSGGGLVDSHDTAGWKQGSEDPLVVAFTSTGRGECLAYSLDRGRNLEEFPGNPVIAHQGRDPKIIWYAPGEHWVMIVYEEPLESGSGQGGHAETGSFGYAIYTSMNLKSWQRESFLPGWYECPELFEIEVDGQPGEKQWVVYGCLKGQFNSAFQVGSFDGKIFTPCMPPSLAHAGPSFYAAQIFNNAPQGRQIMLGWLQGAAYPDMPFSQGMTVPLELSLRRSADETEPYRLCFYPVEELDQLRRSEVCGSQLNLAGANALLAFPHLGELLDLRLEVDTASPFTLHIGEYPLTWDPAHAQIHFAGQTASASPAQPRLSLRLLVDRSVTEVFFDGGWAAFAAMTLFPTGERTLRLDSDSQNIALSMHTLNSIW